MFPGGVRTRISHGIFAIGEVSGASRCEGKWRGCKWGGSRIEESEFSEDGMILGGCLSPDVLGFGHGCHFKDARVKLKPYEAEFC